MLRAERRKSVLTRLQLVLHFVGVNYIHRLVAIVEVVASDHVLLVT